MKKYLFLVLMMPFGLIAQENSSIKSKQFVVGFNISPQYCYRSILTNISEYQSLKEYYNESDKPIFGFTSGISLDYFFNSKTIVETGLFYSHNGYKNGYSSYPGSQYNGYPAQQLREDSKYYWNYLEIPVVLKYLIGKKRIHFITSFGIIPQYFLTGKRIQTLQYQDGQQIKNKFSNTVGVRNFNLVACAGIGLDIQLKDYWNMRIEPVYRSQIFTEYKSDLYIPIRLESLGCNIGVYYRLYRK